MFRGGLKWKGKCAVAQRVSDSRCEDRKSESTKFDSFKLNTTLSNLRWKQSKKFDLGSTFDLEVAFHMCRI